MRIFITGASGWIGSAVTAELLAAGHKVLGYARSDAAADVVAGLGADVLRGDLDDLDALRAGVGRHRRRRAPGLHPRLLPHAGRGRDRPAGHRHDGHRAGGQRPASGHRVRHARTFARAGRDREGRPRSRCPPTHRECARGARLRQSRRPLLGCPVRTDRPRSRRSRLRGHPGRNRPREGRIGLHRRRRQPLAGGASTRRGEPGPAGGAGCSGRLSAARNGRGRHSQPGTSPKPSAAASTSRSCPSRPRRPSITSIGSAASSEPTLQPRVTLTRQLLGWEPTHQGLIADLDAGYYYQPPRG